MCQFASQPVHQWHCSHKTETSLEVQKAIEHVMYKYVHPAAVLSALQWLKENSRLYNNNNE